VVTAAFEESSAVTTMLKAVPAVCVVAATVTEKWVATRVGAGWEDPPHPLRKHKQEIEIRTNSDFFMVCLRLAFLVRR
jgi:hypothetical protein